MALSANCLHMSLELSVQSLSSSSFLHVTLSVPNYLCFKFFIHLFKSVCPCKAEFHQCRNPCSLQGLWVSQERLRQRHETQNCCAERCLRGSRYVWFFTEEHSVPFHPCTRPLSVPPPVRTAVLFPPLSLPLPALPFSTSHKLLLCPAGDELRHRFWEIGGRYL